MRAAKSDFKAVCVVRDLFEEKWFTFDTATSLRTLDVVTIGEGHQGIL